MDVWHDTYLDERTTVRFEESEGAERERFIASVAAGGLSYELGSDKDKNDQRVYVNKLLSRMDVFKMALPRPQYEAIHMLTAFGEASLTVRERKVNDVELNTDYL